MNRNLLKKLSDKATLWISLLTAAYLLAVALNVSPLLRGPEEWRWSVGVRQLSPSVGVLILSIAALLIVAIWGSHCLSRNLSPGVQSAVLGFLVVSGMARSLATSAIKDQDPLGLIFDRILSPGSNGYYMTALNIESLT